MAYLITETLQAIASFADQRPEIVAAQIGEPKAPPTSGISAAVVMEAIRVPETVLDASIRVYDTTMRLYLAFTEDGVATEIEMADAVSQLFGLIEGDTDLNTTVRNADIAGQYGRRLEAEWGNIEISGIVYRTCDINLSMIVDQDAASMAA